MRGGRQRCAINRNSKLTPLPAKDRKTNLKNQIEQSFVHGVRMWPSVPAQARRANDVRLPTEARSRRCRQPTGSEMFLSYQKPIRRARRPNHTAANMVPSPPMPQSKATSQKPHPSCPRIHRPPRYHNSPRRTPVIVTKHPSSPKTNSGMIAPMIKQLVSTAMRVLLNRWLRRSGWKSRSA